MVEGVDDRVLGIEVVVRESRRNAGARGDLAHRGLRESAFAEQRERGLEDLLLSLLRFLRHVLETPPASNRGDTQSRRDTPRASRTCAEPRAATPDSRAGRPTLGSLAAPRAPSTTRCRPPTLRLSRPRPGDRPWDQPPAGSRLARASAAGRSSRAAHSTARTARRRTRSSASSPCRLRTEEPRRRNRRGGGGRPFDRAPAETAEQEQIEEVHDAEDQQHGADLVAEKLDGPAGGPDILRRA